MCVIARLGHSHILPLPPPPLLSHFISSSVINYNRLGNQLVQQEPLCQLYSNATSQVEANSVPRILGSRASYSFIMAK